MTSVPAFFLFRPTSVAAAVARLTRLTATGLVFPLAAFGQTAPDSVPQAASQAPVKSLGVVTINSGQPTSLPTQIPTTMEGITRERIGQTINATDSEDALKYLPSLLVRKRYVGDYNHAVCRAAPWAPATARARRFMPTASCCPTTSATVSAV